MGRIKSTLIKRTARTFAKEDYFSGDFERNKKILGSTMPSKSVRNKIAGYIGRLKKMKSKETTKASMAVQSQGIAQANIQSIQTDEIEGEEIRQVQ